MKCKLAETELCSFCHDTKETLIHLICFCPFSVTLWSNLRDKLRNTCGLIIEFTPEEILFGYNNCSKTAFRSLNIIILIAKQYIMHCKWKNITPSFLAFLEVLKYYKTIELFPSFFSLS